MASYPKPRWTLCLWWALAETAGLIIGVAIVAYAIDTGWNHMLRPLSHSGIMGHAVYLAIIGAVVGVVLGFAQWLVLRPQIPRAGWWVLASAGGTAAGSALFFLAFMFMEVVVGWHSPYMFAFSPPMSVDADTILQVLVVLVIGQSVAGALIGAFQWLVLRRSARRAGWWVPLNALAWPAAMYAGELVCKAIIDMRHFSLSTGWDLAGFNFLYIYPTEILPFAAIILGIITGPMLVWLLTSRRTKPT